MICSGFRQNTSSLCNKSMPYNDHLNTTELCFHHPLFDLRGSRKVEIRHTNFNFSSKKSPRQVEGFDLTIVKKLSTFRPHVCLE